MVICRCERELHSFYLLFITHVLQAGLVASQKRLSALDSEDAKKHAKSMDHVAVTLCSSIIFQLSLTKMASMVTRSLKRNESTRGMTVTDMEQLPVLNEGDVYERYGVVH